MNGYYGETQVARQTCMNSKAEFHQPSIVRVNTILGNHNEEQTGRSASQGGGRGARGGRGGRSRGRTGLG